MTLTAKFVNKYENYKTRAGNKNYKITEDDEANQSRAEECDIKMIINKYGIIPAELCKQASEPLYLDCRGIDLTLTERLQQREQVKQYFETLPAEIRNKYGDAQTMLEHIKAGKYGDMVKDNVLTEEHKQQLETARLAQKNKINEQSQKILQLQEQIANLQKEIGGDNGSTIINP